MTRIDFYTDAQDKLDLACRLVQKAYRAGHRVVVYSDDATVLACLDRALWLVPSTSFLPHCLATHRLAPETPVLLARKADAVPYDELLVNLDDQWPPDFSRYQRMAEIVSCDDADKGKARTRYRFYRDRGYDISTHRMAEASHG